MGRLKIISKCSFYSQLVPMALLRAALMHPVEAFYSWSALLFSKRLALTIFKSKHSIHTALLAKIS
jgi:hypothetical protein